MFVFVCVFFPLFFICNEIREIAGNESHLGANMEGLMKLMQQRKKKQESILYCIARMDFRLKGNLGSLSIQHFLGFFLIWMFLECF